MYKLDDFKNSQLDAIHGLLRLLESLVNSPIGLVTDIASLRASLPLPLAAQERERQSFHHIRKLQNATSIGTTSATIVRDILEILQALKLVNDQQSISNEWITRAFKVVDRVVARIGIDVRKNIASIMQGVYVIIDPEHTNGRDITYIANQVLDGGACAIQLRDKTNSDKLVLQEANSIGNLCKQAHAIFIVNDQPHIANVSNADGLHLGQQDISIKNARKLLSTSQIIGTSNATLQEALNAESEFADYIAVGSIYNTDSKQNTRSAGLKVLQDVSRAVSVPVVGIGGINISNVEDCVKAGASAVCVMAAVTKASNPKDAVVELSKPFV